MEPRPVAFHDLPAEYFPAVAEFLDVNGKVIHTIYIPGPGAVTIPALAEKHGPVTVRLTYGNGEVEGP